MKGFNNLVFTIILILFQFFVACKKETTIDKINVPIFDSIKDVENNFYKIVKIGNQWWMAEDLKTKSFNDSTPLINGQDENKWDLNLPMYCLYNNDSKAPGLLYNWNVISNSKNICPLGWHIPTDGDWKELEVFLGMQYSQIEKIGWRGTDQGSKIKVEGKKSWAVISYDTWPTNESGFSATAGSNRLYNGKFGDPGLFSTAFYWTSTEYNNDKAYYRYLDYKNSNIFRFYESKKSGYSIRCVKDK